MDLEMTGLEPHRHVIIEIATIVTDDELNIVAEGPDLVIHATPDQLAQMGDFVTEMHTKSGLLDATRASSVTVADAEAETLAFLKRRCLYDQGAGSTMEPRSSRVLRGQGHQPPRPGRHSRIDRRTRPLPTDAFFTNGP